MTIGAHGRLDEIERHPQGVWDMGRERAGRADRDRVSVGTVEIVSAQCRQHAWMVCEHLGGAKSPRRRPPGDLIRELAAGVVIAAHGGQNCLVVREIPTVEPVSVGLGSRQALVG